MRHQNNGARLRSIASASLTLLSRSHSCLSSAALVQVVVCACARAFFAAATRAFFSRVACSCWAAAASAKTCGSSVGGQPLLVLFCLTGGPSAEEGSHGGVAQRRDGAIKGRFAVLRNKVTAGRCARTNRRKRAHFWGRRGAREKRLQPSKAREGGLAEALSERGSGPARQWGRAQGSDGSRKTSRHLHRRQAVRL